MNLQALGRNNSPKRSPNLSPATYFGARSPTQVVGNYDMGQAPELGIHVQRVPDYYYPGTGIQNAEFVHSERQVEGAPDSQQGRLALQPFVGKEIYLGPGSGFLEWGKEFVRQVSFSERACELSWPEDIKTDVLGQQLPAVSDACEEPDRLLLQNSVCYADSSTRMMMLSRLDIHRMDVLRQAEELCQFAQSTEIEARTKHFVRDVGNAVDPRKTFKSKVEIEHQSMKKCYRCGKVGQLKATCPYRKKQIQQHDFILAIGSRGATSKSHWILDSGSSRHLVNDLNLLEDPVEFNNECLTAAFDGEQLPITKQGSVVITVKALGFRKTVRLLDVQYAENLERKIISYGKLEQKGCVLEYREWRRVLVSRTGSVAVISVDCGNKVFFVKVYDDKFRGCGFTTNDIMTVLVKSEHETDWNVPCGTLVEFH
uniref:Uncharacterized protein AlNc14C698G12416 n=1 Tax=Albugo laibachii Nc14 TaxID=890382 RepID=F0X1V3_9STRA|nr:conserved hypothetical protein [Albugo laibachii Nc14]|eukprot:CCA27809.1 conserved hypothetical protein [Albugo laibachii Nc14]